ncbi:GGDEF domain-containing protein [Marinobacter sp. F4216]|uniref:GGDEF domain-containing protein n=1 Tax=Marinobacter sp. F4216 TaxID=2874281 RepID=UPI001CBAD91C|nr:GGDEF domain-containing protein [Marinobacter sp. F4216]MBZ2169253.1 GGDEF domain-containing protein [Marinobacter sp. F4216]
MSELLPIDHRYAGEHEEAQVSRVLTWLSVMATAFLIGIGAKSWASDHMVHAWVLWSFAIALSINMAYFARTGNLAFQKFSLLLIVSILFAYLVATGGESNTGPLWLYAFPPLLFYVTSLRVGTVVLVLCTVIAFIVFSFPELPFVTAEYHTDFKIRFFSTLIFESMFCYILEASRLKARNELVKQADSLEKAARTDELTRLPNRRDMQSRLQMEFSRYQRAGHHFSIALLDLDLFKNINDSAGHDAGDDVLKQFATLAQSIVRQTDVIARWGGEEFLILLPDTSLLQALSLAERLRSEVASYPFEFRGKELPVTISAGVCTIAKAGTLEELLRQADANLYNAKESGRNRIAPRVRTRDEPVAEPADA